MTTDSVALLPAKWREDRHPDPHTDAWTLGYLRAKKEDADELEAALATQPQRRDGELLAVADRVDSLLGADMEDNEAIIEIAGRLRTLATERRGVEVTPGMVIRACNAYFDALPAHGGEAANREAMRFALTVAFQPSVVDGLTKSAIEDVLAKYLGRSSRLYLYIQADIRRALQPSGEKA